MTMELTLQAAARIVDAALAQARELTLKPLTVAVLDAGGHLVAFKREDRSGAVGVSGDLPDQDERCAVAGIESAELRPDVG